MSDGLITPPRGVKIEGVDLSYGDNHVLKGIDLDIRPGEFFAFLGPSGCGKTTLLRLIAGSIAPIAVACLQQRLGITTVFVTHDQGEANTVCDRIAVMNDGVVQQAGTPRELYESLANLFVARFLDAANILEGRTEIVGALRFVVAPGLILPTPPDVAVSRSTRVMVRPQDVAIAPASSASPIKASAVIVDHEFAGSIVRYRMRVGQIVILAEREFRAGDRLFAADDVVSVHIDPSA